MIGESGGVNVSEEHIRSPIPKKGNDLENCLENYLEIFITKKLCKGRYVVGTCSKSKLRLKIIFKILFPFGIGLLVAQNDKRERGSGKFRYSLVISLV